MKTRRLAPALAFAFAFCFLCLDAFAALELPQQVSREAEGPDGALAHWQARVAGVGEDDIGRQTPTVTCFPASGSRFPIGVTKVQCAGSEGSTGSFDVIVKDTTGPVIKFPPHLEVPAPGPLGAPVHYKIGAKDVVDGLVPVHCMPPPGAPFPVGTTYVNCVAKDSRNNTSRGSFPVTVFFEPLEPGEGPRDVIAEATMAEGARIVYDSFDPDGEGGRPPSTGCTPDSGSTFPIGNTKVTCEIGGGFWVVVKDTTAPAIEIEGYEDAGVLAATSSSPGGTVITFNATASDLVDGESAPTCSPASGSVFPVGASDITCTATDSRGNTSSKTFDVKVTLLNSSAPVLTLPADVTVEAAGAGGASVSFDATANDDVDGSVGVTCNPASGSLFAIVTTAVSCSADDSDGNTTTGTFNVTVADTTPPELTVPGDLTAEATGPDGAEVTISTSATDLVDGAITPECTFYSGLFPIGTTAVGCSATDAHGNGTAALFNITVSDTTPPAVSVSGDVTVEATGPDGATATFTGSATDVVDGPVDVSCSAASGSTFAVGTTTVTCTATDAHGNTGSNSLNVNVVDTTPPAVTVPANITAEATSPAGAAVSFTSSATDIVDGSVTASCSPASGSTFAFGTTSVTCTATDAHGNSASKSFSVTVQDTIAPVFVSASPSPSSLWPPNGKMTSVSVSAVVTDAGDASPAVSIYDVTVEGSGEWSVTGPMSVLLRAGRAGKSNGTVYTIHLEAIDDSGNRSTTTVSVVAPHDQRR